MNKLDLDNTMTVRAKSRMQPRVGLEFDSAEAAQAYYTSYAAQAGFRIRIGQLYRSRVDGSIMSRRYVCQQEGFQTPMRTGCPAFIRVQKGDSGKWVLVTMKTEHNHDLYFSGEISPPIIQQKALPDPKPISAVSSRTTGIRSLEDDDLSGDNRNIDLKRLKQEEIESKFEPRVEPFTGLDFTSASEAYKFYNIYAANMGFKVRIGQLFRSKNDGSITSRRFVCSKEGHQHPSRVGCGAYMRIQRQGTTRWVVDRLSKEHNHELDSPYDTNQINSKSFKEELMENLDLHETNGGFSLVKRDRGSGIGIGTQWYNVLLEYFQNRQSEDTGFFYATEVDDNGRCMSVFWADGRSRFSCTQFGDAIVFDTSYRRSSYTVPLASFVGVNHHRQPVLLGCALISDESEESFTWVFQAWARAMSGKRPVSIIADQDKPVQNAIAQVFPGTHHRFSPSQILAKEHENLGPLRSMEEFKFEFESCVSQSQTASEFNSAWGVLIAKYNLEENTWLNEMYEMRKSWVPLYIRGTFFAGIPVDGDMKSYFGTFLTPEVRLTEFLTRYTKAIEHNREEERNEDSNSFNLQPVLHTKDPLEEQCSRLYTITVFKAFQQELLESYNYVGIKINMEGMVSRYLVQRCGNGDERNTVAFNASNLNISCSCRMFEFEGILCRHALKIFQVMNVKEVPSSYILHRWTKNAKYGIIRDVESVGGSEDLKALMVWSLREEARSYIDAGSASIERFKLAFEILQEGRRNLCWQN
ncbi:putative transcription factor FAR family [Helianthus anomalus]